MTKIKSRIMKIISSILGFFGIMTFTSCYGSPVVMYGMGPNYSAVNGYVEGDMDGDGEMENVPNIHVVLKSSSSTSSEPGSDFIEETYTSDEGNYEIFVPGSLQGDYIIEFIDEDGDENGEFETHSEQINFIGEDYEEKVVNPKLKPKKKSE